MATVKFTEDHDWISVDGDVGTVGITNFAQEQLGEVVFVEIPDVGRTVQKGDEVAVVESVKAASEIQTPVSGEIIESHAALEGEPGLVNEDPEGRAWFFKIKLSDPAELDGLLDAEAYKAQTADAD